MNPTTKITPEFYLDSIPAMPVVATKIMHLLGDIDVSVQDIANVISHDQAITAKVLQVANSPFYYLSRKIQNIKQAIVIMGLSGIKSIILAISTRNVYKQPGLLQKLGWDHSIGAALGSFLIAKHTRVISGDDAFVGGLLHDIGKPVMRNSWKDVTTRTTK